MTRKTPDKKKHVTPAPVALRRAARQAVELARRTGTPAWVLKDGKLVDAAKPRPKKGPKTP